MQYDPVKDFFASAIRKTPLLRIIFYKILDIVFLRSWYVKRELRELRKLFGANRINIFDAGAGYGQYTYFMAKNLMPAEIYAVDVKEEWIKDCRNFFSAKKIDNVSFAVEDLTEINHTRRFDIIVSVDVMEHIEEDVKVFNNFYNALKPGGYLLINTPSVFGGSDVHSSDEISFIEEHARDGYSYEDLSWKLKPIGFNVYKSKYSYGFWGDKAWRLGIKYPMLLLNISRLFLLVLPLYFLLTFPFILIMMYTDYTSDNKVGSGITFIAKKTL
jgi:2-polyprenyl-3-methyl-5-hydroxy-6-metoxy-1,4-benzoquinol methylase